MAGDLNVVALVGRLTRDSESRFSGSGTQILSFSVAVGRRVKKGEQWTDETSFLDMAVFGKTAENMAKYLVKGQQVAIQGSLEQQTWEKDGKKMSKVSVHVDSIQLIGGRREGATGGQQERQAPKSQPREDGDDTFDPQAYEDEISF